MRQIEAQDLKPGMTIEWTEYGWTHCGIVSEVQNPERSSLFISFRAADELWMCVGKDHKVTVLKEPQPDEPTAFGARVEVAGVKYVRFDAGDKDIPGYCPWVNKGGTNYCSWGELTNEGHVTVINPDPFANTEPREPRVWDRWADVPDRVTVRLTDVETPYRKVGDRIECKRGGPWVPAFAGEHDLNNYSPFTEVLDA